MTRDSAVDHSRDRVFAGLDSLWLLIVKLSGGGDMRQAGSGNIGAANVTRVAGPVSGILTLLLDAGKGYLAVWLARRLSGGNIRWITVAAVAVVLGHMFSVWLRFRGGKGVATGLGAYLLISGMAVAAAAVVWIVVVVFWRYFSLARSRRRRRCLFWFMSFTRRTLRRLPCFRFLPCWCLC